MIDIDNYDLILLVGKKHVGKDTGGLYLQNLLNWKTYALATPVKQISQITTGLPSEYFYDMTLKETKLPEYYNYTPRQIMQIIYMDLFTDKLSKVMPEFGKNFFLIHFERKFNNN